MYGSWCGRNDKYEIMENRVIGFKQTILYIARELKIVSINSAITTTPGMLGSS